MLEIKDVSKIYGRNSTSVVALNSVSFQVDSGDFVAIMGPSGSGKSTLLNIIGGLDVLSKGAIVLNGERIDNLEEDALVKFRRGKIGYVFQQYHLLQSLTALENVLLPLTFGGGKPDHGKALELLRRVGLEKRASHKPSQLSGGEQQRVAIARALVNDPLLTLADEPTGNMDHKTGKEILDLFDELNREGRSIIMVTHNPEAAERAKGIVFLQDGQIVNTVRK
ncbi:MAG: ABC transporter ATP-binding protein [Dehalococcoidales bacterium]|nr:ABC transporter ATP-binding protein [Dehalococcoidales bacterium]